MTHKYAEIAFTNAVKSVQQTMGSRNAYARRESGLDSHGRLGPNEVNFIVERDSFYIASVSETGWPYIQFRGGPIGFLRVLDDQTLGFADFQGNRQYITFGNVTTNDRVALFLMDYPNRRRLKIFGRMSLSDGDLKLRKKSVASSYDATVEHEFRIEVAAFDWNCPRHITPRFTEAEIVEFFPAIKNSDDQQSHNQKNRHDQSN